MYVAYCPNLQQNCLIINDSLGYIFHILDDDFTNILWQCCWSWHLRVWFAGFYLANAVVVFFCLFSFVCFVYFMSCIVISFSPFSIVIILNTRRYSYIAFAMIVFMSWEIVRTNGKRQMIRWFGFYHLANALCFFFRWETTSLKDSSNRRNLRDNEDKSVFFFCFCSGVFCGWWWLWWWYYLKPKGLHAFIIIFAVFSFSK